MTVSELIAKMQELDGDLPVVRYDIERDTYFDVDEVNKSVIFKRKSYRKGESISAVVVG